MSTETLTISAALAEQLRKAAAARGQTPDAYAAEELAMAIAADAEDVDADLRRLEEPGANIPLDQAFDRFEAEIARLQATKDV